ncbi:MAG: 3'-5' exonuclease [Alphaproteobacteria bacterium RIFCSPLOWO2_01_FULL_40_26]|nr:MAG: 3'-5' exonuclease [Alphaproteobacteria bacterium RIFCSPHIGHO2_02_FULL_40_34]OFW88894.1 MAG: 3'-5' exonuclease [Alphaproteobacteria bacterium RIFCSPHIGHO2_01_FULL_40_8]OFW94555.1 MAG: 3'-5' exonuclease [Alphaproteobacteria bacterium RIFCSPLOWO2_01_FULL_40_26]OFX10304.1 MAG: 3'-5' exonuclease [Alphaproteobacteria bacterium RIFCSPLOWO2_02_FULL_40_19]OFX11905.1 MAG: 3'-5' exonuclease [Alphaproteobacteria bacterium RIFCSPLOWO2_12_FULL_40_11]
MQHQNLFIFDIETIPDLNAARNLLDLQNATKEELRHDLIKYHLNITDQKNSFLRQPFHQIIAISFLEAEIERNFNGQEIYHITDIRSGGDLSSSEADLVKGFFSHLKKHLSRLVSFNGKNFDMPVLKYAAMKHSVEAAWLYKSGDKWNNYNQRYSLDWHCDLAEAFSDFGASAKVKMNELCAAFGLPGKIGVDGSMVTQLYDEGKLQEIRDYCETDVINTYLLYMIYQHHNGSISHDSFVKCKKNLRQFLEKKSAEKSHFAEFLKLWPCRKSTF